MDAQIATQMATMGGMMVLKMWTRYLIVCGGAFFVLWILQPERLKSRRIQKRAARTGQLMAEVKSSLTGMLGIIAPSILAIPAWHAGYIQVYMDLSERSVWYLPVSLVALIVAADTYYYWAHYMMHSKRVYRWTHKLHHQSTNPSPLAAYSFAMSEALMHGAFLPIILLVLPMNIWMLAAYVLWFALSETYVHLGYELLPSWWVKSPVTRWVATATYHNMHHQYFRYNYGVYFTFWDRMMGTVHPKYEARFEEITAAPRAAQQPEAVEPALKMCA
jgi:lathosterol oxidase